MTQSRVDPYESSALRNTYHGANTLHVSDCSQQLVAVPPNEYPVTPAAHPSSVLARPLTLEALHIPQVLSHAIASSRLGDAAPCAVFYDLTALREQRRALDAAFPPSTLHCFAVKACPLVAVVAEIAATDATCPNFAGISTPSSSSCAACSEEPAPPPIQGSSVSSMGAECASIGEIAVAIAAGVSPERIIFDAPAKTETDLRFCLEKGVHINANSVKEVHKIGDLARQLTEPPVGPTRKFLSSSVIGLRINPQVRLVSRLQETFTASATSKFGVPLTEDRQQIIATFQKYTFLTCLHCHIGSQGCALETLAEGIAAVVELAEEITLTCPGQITCIDIGGGLPVDYNSDQVYPTFEEYGTLLRRRVPSLWKYKIITEFGRRLIAKTGWVAAKIEEVKSCGGRTIAICHAGADLFVRPVYVPSKWSHRVEIFESDGRAIKAGPCAEIDIGGPLCFSGDLLAFGRKLPIPEENCWVIIRDTGAYTLSTYSRLTSQLFPAVYGYEHCSPDTLKVLKRRETLEELVRFWDL